MLIHKADVIFLTKGLKTELAHIREKMGIQSDTKPPNDLNI